MTTRPQAPARLALGAVLVLAVGGTFTLDRVNPAWPALDLRWVGIGGVALVWAIDRVRPGRASGAGGGSTLLVLGLWSVWLALAAAWTSPGARLAEAITGLVVMWLLAAFAVSVANGVEDVDRLVAWFWGWVLVIAVVYALAAVAAGPGAQGRFSAFGGGPNVFVRIMAFGLLACIALAHRRGVLLVAPLLLLGAVLSGSRGGLLALVLVGLVLGLPAVRRVSARTVVAVSGAVATVGVLSFVLVADVRTLLVGRFLDQTVENRYGSGRGEIFTKALDLGLAHPWFGAGLDSYYALIGQFESVEYPHNLTLATFAYGGVVGLLLLLVAVAVPTIVVLGSTSRAARLLAAAGWYVILAAQFSGDLYDSRFAWIFLGLAAAVAARSPRAAAAPALRWWTDEVPAPRSPART